MTTFLNFTPHDIVLNDGRRFPSMGVARVDSSHTDFDKNGICSVKFGDIKGLPDPKDGVFLIVSALVMNASKRDDLVAPATGHPDTVRNDKGHIVSVPGFVR